PDLLDQHAVLATPKRPHVLPLARLRFAHSPSLRNRDTTLINRNCAVHSDVQSISCSIRRQLRRWECVANCLISMCYIGIILSLYVLHGQGASSIDGKSPRSVPGSGS